MLRTLVEGTALLYADLHPEDAEYAGASARGSPGMPAT
jgi:hypothetical protein